MAELQQMPSKTRRFEAKPVGQLRKLDTWPDNLVLSVAEQRDTASCVKIGKVNVKGRVSPKT